MKKLALSILTIMAISSTSNAADPSLYPNSISIMGGYTISASESRLDNNHAYSFRYTNNDFGIDNFGLGAFQLALDYTPDIKYKDNNAQTSSIRFGPNLLWYLNSPSEITPYFLLGLGLEHLSNPTGDYSSLSFYANGGAGVEFQIRNDISLVGEAKYHYANEKRKGTTLSCGVKFSFGDY